MSDDACVLGPPSMSWVWYEMRTRLWALVALILACNAEIMFVHGASETIRGIDVSEYQGHIDWEALRDSGAVSFCIAKATEGLHLIDAEFGRNWKAMRAMNIPVRGAYHFARPSHDPEGAARQASAFVDTVGRFHDGEFAVLDIESDFAHDTPSSGSGEHIAGAMDADALVLWCLSWISAVLHSSGLPPHRVVVYTGAWFWNPHTTPGDARDALTKHFPLWVSSYTDATEPESVPQGWLSWLLWQFTDNGSIDGIDGPVDMSTFRGTVSDLEAFFSERDTNGRLR